MDINLIDAITGAVGGVFGGAAKAAGEAVIDLIMKFLFHTVADAVAAITNTLITAITDTTTVDLAGGWFTSGRQRELVALVMAMSASLLLVFILLTIVRSLIAGQPGQMVRAVLVDVPFAVFASVAVVTVTGMLLAITDAASAAVLGDVGSSLGQFRATLGVAEILGEAGLLGMIFGALYIAGAMVVWLQLLLRAALLYLVVTFAPLGFVARVYPGGRQIARKTIEIGIALIVSKFAIALAFATGGAALASSSPTATGADGVDLRGMLVGSAIMLLAAFMPWLVWRIIPVFEAAAVTQGVERAPIRAATTAASVALTAASAARLAGGGSQPTGASTGIGSADASSGNGPPPGGATAIATRDVARLATSLTDATPAARPPAQTSEPGASET